MLEKMSLKSQFILSFVLIMTLSLIATIVTYFGGYLLFLKLQYEKIYPANYYEKQIPAMEEEIKKKGVSLFNETEKPSLEMLIPSEGVLYQIMDENGSRLYGTEEGKLIKSKEDLYDKINTTFAMNGRYVKIVPIFDSQGTLKGAASFSYTLTPHYAREQDKMWIMPLFILIAFSPFLYILLFTWLFSKKLSENIRKPVMMLIDASRKVREKDLDFHIEYTANNEVGRLCQSFNEMKNELKNSLLAQWRAEQERQEMVQALAHDLKTPLSVIQGYAESLLDEPSGDLRKREKYLRIITDHARKGLKLIQEMLYASEMERPTATLRITPVDLSSFLMEKKESYEMIGKGKEIHFNVEVVYEKPDQAICPVDVEKLDRILDNIVGNSIRYTPEGGTITIRAQVTHDHVRFTICDTGKGFSKKDLSNLFQKFYRGDQSRSTKEGHAGLGLYVAKKMVEMHGGNMTAFNADKGGACVEFELYFNGGLYTSKKLPKT
ncbi:sensor histidine kinase [Thermicanus aegyptius]|uniref:sensor histidine kinase n=1 Tax=Thermicanus aegyptius TaxID=94009 RepID=UPI00042638E2|nr:HAMP domain-containing sensor histidine kinase [Thermicanus aegyptius]